ncbi:MAG: hypothetical protein ACTHNA_04855 [Sphingopyxis terrae]|jgi:hypothetical protein|uniref:hypothetical protein n=1 Tax=Sphingopyxis terrae TaxID=33052 RepID=UPI003F7FC6B7
MRPDLDDPEARAAYRRELLGVGRGMRRVGFSASLLALALLMGPRMGGPWMLGPLPTQYWGWAALLLSWTLFVVVILRRTRHHKRRMAE